MNAASSTGRIMLTYNVKVRHLVVHLAAAMALTHGNLAVATSQQASLDRIGDPAALANMTIAGKPAASTIVYSTVGRAQYAFDIYSRDLGEGSIAEFAGAEETQVTDGISVNTNGAFDRHKKALAFVSERDGNMELYSAPLENGAVHKHGLERLTYSPALQARPIFLDRPLFTKDGRIIFASTHRPAKQPRQGWTAMYSLSGGDARRLTPDDAADYSPALSPDGELLAAATGSGRTGDSDVVFMRAADGLNRRVVARNGGWPAFSADGAALFFHRQDSAGRWGVFRVDLEGGQEMRLTPSDRDVFTPATSHGQAWVAVATPDEQGNRQIAALHEDEESGEWVLTPITTAATHHYNPFLSTDGSLLGYHRCRCYGVEDCEAVPVLEHHTPVIPGVDVVRIDGSFPSFSDDDSHIVYNPGFTGVAAIRRDGSRQQLLHKGPAFGTSASYYMGRKVAATAEGPTFAAESDDVNIVLLTDGRGHDGEFGEVDVLTLTANGTGNNAFPSFSSDGSEIVFRSGRSGYKNLYIMPAEGEGKGLIRLTEGPWDDTMPGWTPASGWIVFSSSREYAGANRPAGAFDLWMVRPDGSGLHKLFDSHGGLANHPKFSPDVRSVVFTSDYAGYSAEEISVPHQFQPYGDLWAIDVEGSNLRRLTHDPYENGTPAWGGGGTTKKTAGGATPLACDFDDSVDWLRPKGLARAVGSVAADSGSREQGAASQAKWCPFTGRQASAGVAVSASR